MDGIRFYEKYKQSMVKDILSYSFKKYVSERLGHKSVKITADTYLHIIEKVEDGPLALYEKYLK